FPSEYIYDPDTIAEVARVLRPGGRLIIIEGANLLPVGFLQSFLFLVQILVYGPSAVYGPRKKRNLDEEMARNQSTLSPEDRIIYTNRDTAAIYTNRDTAASVTTNEVPHAWFGQHIPLEQFSLRRRSERVRSQRWEVYITIGEKIQ